MLLSLLAKYFWALVFEKRASILGPARRSSALSLNPLPWQSGVSISWDKTQEARLKAAAFKSCVMGCRIEWKRDKQKGLQTTEWVF